MAAFMVNIGGIRGEVTMLGYEGQIECFSMRHAIALPVVAQGAARTEGASRHGAIELTRAIDMASPPLRLSVSSGTNLGTITITQMCLVDGEIKPVEIITLGNTYVVRIGIDTLLTGNTLDDRPIEMFSIEYSDIEWIYKYFDEGGVGGSVQAGWSVVTQTII